MRVVFRQFFLNFFGPSSLMRGLVVLVLASVALGQAQAADPQKSCAEQLKQNQPGSTGSNRNGRTKQSTLDAWPQPVKRITPRLLQNDLERALKNQQYFWHLFTISLRQETVWFARTSVVAWPEESNVQRFRYILTHMHNKYDYDLYTIHPDHGQSLLNEAVRTRSTHIVKTLLKLKFDPNFISPATGESALHILARQLVINKADAQLDAEIAKLLFQYGADVNQVFGLQQLPPQEKVLIHRGVHIYLDWKKKMKQKESRFITRYPRLRQKEKLYSKDDIDFISALDQRIQLLKGLTPLHIAIVSQNLLAVKLFLQYKADTTLNPPDKSLGQLVGEVYGRHKMKQNVIDIYSVMKPYIQNF